MVELRGAGSRRPVASRISPAAIAAGGTPSWLVVLRRMTATATLAWARDVALFTELDRTFLKMAGSSAEAHAAVLRGLSFVPVDLFNGLAELPWGAVIASPAQDPCSRLRSCS
jgi:hypothetical protein